MPKVAGATLALQSSAIQTKKGPLWALFSLFDEDGFEPSIHKTVGFDKIAWSDFELPKAGPKGKAPQIFGLGTEYQRYRNL